MEELHQEGIGVILDWTPAQFPRFDAGLEKFDGTPLYEVQDPAMAVHPMWGTMLYNYGSPMVKDLVSTVLPLFQNPDTAWHLHHPGEIHLHGTHPARKMHSREENP